MKYRMKKIEMKQLIRQAFILLFLSVLLWSVAGSERAAAGYDEPKALPQLTGKKVVDFLNVAESQKDYRESVDTSETIYSEWAGQSGKAWCSEFLCWSAAQAGIADIIPKFNSAKGFRKFYSQQGSYFFLTGGIEEAGCGCSSFAVDTISLKEIRPGDILIIETKEDNPEEYDSLDHTAVVKKVEGNKIHTIEGNVNKTYWIAGKKYTLGRVTVRTREAMEIHGICRPNYGDFCEEYGTHAWQDGVVTREATCTETEIITHACSWCNDKKQIEGSKKPHTEVTDPAIAASCEIAGLTAGTHCSVCSQVVTAQQPVKARGHVWDHGAVQIEARPLADGWIRYTCSTCKTIKTECIEATGAPAEGTLIRDQKTEAMYLVTRSGLKGAQAAYAGSLDKKNPSITIRSSVVLDGIVYKITSIADQAFAKNKYLEEIEIASGVKKVGKQAFYKCSRLKSITVKSKNLKKTAIGTQAFKGIHKKAVFYVPAKKLKTYRTVFAAKGAGKKNSYRIY